jgi:pyruvate dehydrogenase E2 component (dihydrolipoamide acetyltransferase)
MAYEFNFPDVGEGIVEGEIVKWRVKEGDTVKEDDILVEIETDKAVVEVPSPKAGKILKIYHKEGDTVKVGEPLVSIGEKGEAAEEPAKETEPKEKEEKPVEEKKESFGVVGQIPETLEEEEPAEKPKEEPEEKPAEEEKPKEAPSGVVVLPAVRRLARDLGVSLEGIQGSGRGGRITEEDVRSASSGKKVTRKEATAGKVTRKYDSYGYVDKVPLKGIRKITALRMVESLRRTASVTHMEVIDVTDLVRIREKEKISAKNKGIHLTYMPFIIKAVVQALKLHPYMNSSLDEEHEEIVLKKYYNIGIAVDMGVGGLIVPVVKNGDKKSILELAQEIEKLADKARARKIEPSDLKGGTFTITNVGALGGTYANPVINYPEVGILATGSIRETPVVKDGVIQIRSILPVSLTFDHRVIDGAEAARFVNDIKTLLEDPEFMLMK